MRLIPLALLLLAGLAHAGTADLTWTNATTNTDGTAIPATGAGSLASTALEYGTCVAGSFGTKIGQITVTAPTASASVNMVVVQQYCFRAAHTNTFGNVSAFSNVATKNNPAPTPGPPGSLTVSNLTAYNVTKLPNGFGTVPVAKVRAGTACDTTQSVNGLHVVPVSAVVEWLGDVRPVVLVAQCG